MVVEVLVAQAQPQHPLFDQRLHRVFDSIRVSIVGEAFAQTTQNPGPLLHFAQEHATGVGGDLAAVEPAHDVPSVQALKSELCSGTLCGHKVASLLLCKLLISQHL